MTLTLSLDVQNGAVISRRVRGSEDHASRWHSAGRNGKTAATSTVGRQPLSPLTPRTAAPRTRSLASSALPPQDAYANTGAGAQLGQSEWDARPTRAGRGLGRAQLPAARQPPVYRIRSWTRCPRPPMRGRRGR